MFICACLPSLIANLYCCLITDLFILNAVFKYHDLFFRSVDGHLDWFPPWGWQSFRYEPCGLLLVNVFLLGIYLEVELPVYVVPVYTVCVYVRVRALYLLTLLPGKVRVPVVLNPCLHWLVSRFPILAIPVGNWCNMFSSTLYFPRDQGEFLNLGDPGACLCADGKALVEMESFKNSVYSSAHSPQTAFVIIWPIVESGGLLIACRALASQWKQFRFTSWLYYPLAMTFNSYFTSQNLGFLTQKWDEHFQRALPELWG